MRTAFSRLYKPLWLALFVVSGLVVLLMLYRPATAHPVAQWQDACFGQSKAERVPRQGEATNYLPMIETCKMAATATPTPDPWTDPDAAIEVFSPITTGVYHSPIEVIGFSRTFEASVLVRVLDSKGEVIGERVTQGGSVDGFDFFHTQLRFYVKSQQKGTVEVFELSARDGGEVHKVSIPVILLPGQRALDIETPNTGQSICTPVIISGYSDTFEANVVASLLTRSGEVLTMTTSMGGNFGIYARFSTVLSTTIDAPQPLLVDVYGGEGQGIGNMDQTRIPVSVYNCKQ